MGIENLINKYKKIALTGALIFGVNYSSGCGSEGNNSNGVNGGVFGSETNYCDEYLNNTCPNGNDWFTTRLSGENDDKNTYGRNCVPACNEENVLLSLDGGGPLESIDYCVLAICAVETNYCGPEVDDDPEVKSCLSEKFGL